MSEDRIYQIRRHHAAGDHYAELGQAAIGELLAEIDRPERERSEWAGIAAERLRAIAAQTIVTLQAQHERDCAVDDVARIAGVIVGYVRAKRDGLGELAHWWWELQQIANEIAAPGVASGASIAGVSPSPAPLVPQSIESLRDYAVLDGERLQSLWAEIDRLRRQLYLLQNERDNLADNVHERDTRSAWTIGDGLCNCGVRHAGRIVHDTWCTSLAPPLDVGEHRG